MDFMERALDLAEKAAGGVAPRPPVGAVIVGADGETIVGEGATQPSPGPHAEAVAIGIAGDAARGGTIYCTLEPHQGHFTTPPCSQAIINAGIKHVVCPTVDPNPQVAGRGFEELRKAGVRVTNDVDEPSARRADGLIEGFAKHITTGLPFVTVKWAMSLDGKIATRTGDSKWITSGTARAHAHRLRYRSDAVVTGIGTVIADNPRLTARDPQSGKRLGNRPYIRVVIDSEGRMPQDAALLEEEGEVIQAVARNTASAPLDPGFRRDDGGGCRDDVGGCRDDGGGARPLVNPKPPSIPPWIIKGEGCEKGTPDSGEMFEGQGRRARNHVIAFPNNDNRTVDLAALIRHLGERGCTNVLVEAGEKLTGELFDLKLVDKVVAYVSTDKIIGGQTAISPVGGIGPATMGDIARLSETRIEHLGNDIAIIGYVDYPQETN